MIFSRYNVTKGQSYFRQFTAKNIIFTVCILVISVCINCIVATIVTKNAFPLFLDSIMTIGVAALCGLVPGVLCAVFSNGILFLLGNTPFPYISCHILTAVLAWLVFDFAERRRQRSSTFEKEKPYTMEYFLFAGVFSAVSNAFLRSVIYLYLDSVDPQVSATPTIMDLFLITQNLSFSTYLAETIENVTDKMLTALISFGLYEAARRIYRKF